MASSRAAKENEPVPPNVRKDVLERDDHKCQFCGRSKGDAGGFLRFEVHHKDQNPDGGYHDLTNLKTLCVDCHRWMHLKPDPEDAPITLSDEEKGLLRPQDYNILEVLADSGPLTTGEIRDAITVDVSVMSVRERLWKLGGLNDRVDSRETQLLDQDVKTGRWGLPEDIAHPERGRIPPSIEVLIQRIEDEWVRDAVDRGVDRHVIADTFGIAKRATYYRENRARAYQFPLDDIASDRGRPARVAPEERNAIRDGRGAQLRLTASDGEQPDESDAPACHESGDITEIVNNAQRGSDEEVRSN